MTLRRLLLMAAALPITMCALTPEASIAARDKFNRIVEDQMEPGETIVVSEDELNSYLKYDYAPSIPEGVRDLKVRIHQGTSVITAIVDFAKVSAGGAGNFLIRMLGDNKEVLSRVKFASRNGMVQVDVESMKVNNTEMAGMLTTWLVNAFVAPETDGFELGKRVPLQHKLDQLNLEPGRVVFVAK